MHPENTTAPSLAQPIRTVERAFLDTPIDNRGLHLLKVGGGHQRRRRTAYGQSSCVRHGANLSAHARLAQPWRACLLRRHGDPQVLERDGKHARLVGGDGQRLQRGGVQP